DDRARLGVAVRPVETANPQRQAVLAVIISVRDIGPVRGRIAAEIVAEPLDIARMRGVRPAAMADEMALDGAVLQVDEVEARLARRPREVGDPDRVARPDLVLVERGLGAGEQLRIDT